ncbi:MAG: sulfotransferase [Anaerolineae bacterium]
MAFDFKSLARFTYKQLFRSRGTPYRLSPKRIGLLLLSYILYTLIELFNWLGLALDAILFPAYRQLGVKGPVFIIGNPRSGTTFLHRLLARDEKTFSTMRTWEMLVAPSVTMRKVFWALSALDRRLGRPAARCLGMLEESWQADNVVHRVAMRAPEEDEYLLVHIFSCLKIWLYVAMLDEAERYTYFDSQMPEEDKNRIMTFYTRCLQRHLYAHNHGDKRYLAKNPHFSPVVDTLYRFFPDVKIIYLARNPLDMIPSYVSLKENEWRLLGDPEKAYGSREYILDMAGHWYSYPLERLGQASQDSYVVVNFNHLVNDARGTVREIYSRFGLEISPAFDEMLRQATEQARNHESEHEYSLREMGLTCDQIVSSYAEVFERFGFDIRECPTLGH